MSPTHSTPKPDGEQTGLTRFYSRVANSRFFTVSLLLHVIIVLMAGSTVIFQAHQEAPDFEAGGESFMSESTEQTPPEEVQPANLVQSPTAPTPDVSAPPITSIITAGKASYTLKAAMPETRVTGLSETMNENMANASKKAGDAAAAAAAGAMGRAGGTMKTLFGRKIEATKLGVILDVSGSAHPHLADALKEIEKAFPDAIEILYPGCGLVEFRGKRPHEIRKLSSVQKKDLPADAAQFTTAGQLVKALKIPEFERVTKLPAMKDKLFVSWYDADAKAPAGLTGHVSVAFEDLMHKGVDTIYWYADFQDQVNPEAMEDVMRQLRNKKIKVHVHNFAGTNKFPEPVLMLAKKTGGTSDLDKDKDKEVAANK